MKSNNLEAVLAEAKQYSATRNAKVSVWQVGFDSFIIACCAVERGVLVASYNNGRSCF